MKKILLLSCCLVYTAWMHAQGSTIMVCNANGSICQPYSNIDTAITAAAAGSVIYLPGGVFNLNVGIGKEIHLIGAGYSMDSSMITGTTIINGNISMSDSASRSSFEGFYLTGNILGPSSPALDSLTIRYCHFNFFSAKVNHSIFHACIFRSGGYGDNNFYDGTNNQINNCYISNLYNLSGSVIDHCVGLNYFNNVVLTTVKNSICHTYPNSPFAFVGWGNSLYHTVYVSSCYYYCLGAIYVSNIAMLPLSSLFANGFNYNDMHLLPGSPALTAGENGTEVGVYGGLFPFKEGAVPGNPHIFQKNISASTNANGELPVQIKVRAEHY